jgi:nicotinate-nucleotide adenylyltransferase
LSKVGVLGGTFDPLHFGHLRAAEVARDELTLETVLFVPAANPPHKPGDAVTNVSARVSMLELALADEEGFELSRVEIARDGPSYTIETLGELHANNPTDEFWFITGSDAFLEIRTWKDWEALLERYAFVVHERPGVGIDAAAGVVPEEYRERIVFLTREMLNVSSTDIRRLAGNDQSIRFLVPGVVDSYVRRNRLYQ